MFVFCFVPVKLIGRVFLFLGKSFLEMSKNHIAHLRQEYSSEIFDVSHVSQDPIEQFGIWFSEALNCGQVEPNAMTLSTCTASGRPKGRIVLLKGFDHRGFIFFTNYNSHKGQELAEVPFGSLTFWWDKLHRQVRIEGGVEKIPPEESAEYFQSRPRSSQIGAWASPQSQIIAGRGMLEEKVDQLEKEFENQPKINRPEHWGGYLVKPEVIEFWQGRLSRLHDRIRYDRQENGNWTIVRLAP